MVRGARQQSKRGKSRIFLINFKFDDLVEVFTDKLVAKIPSTCTGTVKSINFGADEVCLVGQALIEIEVEGGEGV